MCPHCGKKIPNNRRLCPYCKHRAKDTQKRKIQRKIPIVTAVIAIIFFAIIVFGVASVIIARLGSTSESDVGLHLDGIWVIESPTFNDEIITFVFADETFTSTTEAMIFGASPEILEDIRDFHVAHSGASFYATAEGDGNYRLLVTSSGTFTLDGNSILLVMNNDVPLLLPFYWDGDGIIINGDRYLR
ncbi:MAG: zinc ribbon domain-containing protein [Defluviitaleaceae bacterium]|nr:zinc ribbon domain-containing protein [Defluviitaleaceae bacterium]